MTTRKTLGLALAALAVAGLSFAGASAFASQAAQQQQQQRPGQSAQAGSQDIIAVATAAGQFNTLAKALQAADLVETLQGEGPFTVFAPTDEAFAKLPSGTLETLLKPENKDKLRDILLYHVVSGKVLAADVVKLTEAETVQGEAVRIKAEGGKVMLNGKTNVVKTDVTASNGVIHVIDSILMPTGEAKPGAQTEKSGQGM